MSDEELYDDGVDTDIDSAMFDLDNELEGVRPAAEIQDPVPGNHIFYVRPYVTIDTLETDEGNMVVARLLYEVLATESEAAMDTVGGLFSEMIKLGGKVQEYEKYSAAKQIKDGKQLLATRLAAFNPGITGKPSELIAAINDRYDDTDTTGVCAKVRISAKLKGEYVNIRRVKVINIAFPLLAAGGEGSGVFTDEELEDWKFWVPNAKNADDDNSE